MNGGYRKRVPVTLKIRETVAKLLESEQDTQKKKKHPSKWYRYQTAVLLNLSENENPSTRSYENLVRELRGKMKEPNPLDNPWSIGISAAPEYSSLFPPESIPAIIKFSKCSVKSIRQAMWLVRLKYLIEKIYSEYPDKVQGYNEIAALVYAQAHYISDVCDNEYFDSSELDKILVSGDFDRLMEIHVNNIFWRQTK